jgi:hypothetical protein
MALNDCSAECVPAGTATVNMTWPGQENATGFCRHCGQPEPPTCFDSSFNILIFHLDVFASVSATVAGSIIGLEPLGTLQSASLTKGKFMGPDIVVGC